MTIPTASNYPDDFDTDTNLYLVHDSLRMTLADDYNPGDTSIVVTGETSIMDLFPPTGIITLTDQCAEILQRAISFYYGSKTDYTFDDLEILPGFEDVVKPKSFTHVTLNVVADHHNNLKDALIAIEDFLGVQGTIDTMPYGSTLTGRINFLRKLVFTPKAWFKTIGATIGLAPLSVVFQDQSFRLGSGDVLYLWDFGDSSSIISTISTSSIISCVGISECNLISKIYTTPGKFDVTLTVSNIYGSDTVVFQDLINPRIEAPDEAIVTFLPTSLQIITSGLPSGGPYTTPPSIRSSIDAFIDMEIPAGVNPATGRSYGGEALGPTDIPLDAITTYTWSMGDDITHANQQATRGLYSMGGIYDMVLRTDTVFGAYRITKYQQSIDIVENTNLWLWTFDPTDASESYLGLSGNVVANEFGLISESFKTASNSLTVYRDDAFLESPDWAALDPAVVAQARREFRRNVGFTPVGTTSSGNWGDCMLFYASGGGNSSPLDEQVVNVVKYNAFSSVYDITYTAIPRPWNWVFLGDNGTSYFILGQGLTTIPSTNPSYQVKTAYDLTTFTYSDTTFTSSNYKNGAHELMQHVSIYTESGIPTNGWFATYRSTWKNSTGYFLRNDNVGTFFRIKNFYKTEGTVAENFVNIKKLPDMEGATKLDGQLVTLTSGIFFFTNASSITAYNDTTGVWETGGPSTDSIAFSSVQDTSIENYNSGWNTLLASSNNDYVAYLSYDYSRNVFVKFNGQDLTLTTIQARPDGSQFAMGVY